MLASVFAVMTLLAVVTYGYNRFFKEQRHERAQEHFRMARTLADYGYHEEAVEHYRDALLEDRSSFAYRLGLALALYRSDRYQEAQLQLLELRAAQPNHAVVNQMLARIAQRQQRWDEAIGYFRAAVYGFWPSNPLENRIQARLELIQLLETRGDRRQTIAELLSLLQDAPENDQIARRVGLALFAAGAYSEASEVLSKLIEGSEDPELLAAAGEVFYHLGALPEARDALTRSIAARPDREVERMAKLVSEILALDPRARGLSRTRRYRRSKDLLERIVSYIDGCSNPVGEAFVGPDKRLPQQLSSTLTEAREVVAARRTPRELDEAFDRNLRLAEQLWDGRRYVCRNVWDEDEALVQLMERMPS